MRVARSGAVLGIFSTRGSAQAVRHRRYQVCDHEARANSARIRVRSSLCRRRVQVSDIAASHLFARPIVIRGLGRSDEAALIRLWQEKRGEVSRRTCPATSLSTSGSPLRNSITWYERNTGRRVSNIQHQVKHSAIPWMAATLDGTVEEIEAVFEAKFMLPWSFSEEGGGREIHAAGPAQHVRHSLKDLGALDYHRRRQVGRDHDPHGPAVSQRPGLGGKEFWRCVQCGRALRRSGSLI
jgi:hypothetical protein